MIKTTVCTKFTVLVQVVKDVVQVCSVYVVLFIPMTAIFWKTVYSHVDDSVELDWYDNNILNLFIKPSIVSNILAE